VTGRPPPVPGARTPEEREAARRERQARRPSSDGHGTWRPQLPRPPRPQANRLLPVLAVGAAAVLVAWFVLSLFQPFAGDGKGKVHVVIPKGAGAGDIADILEKRGVVSSSFFFSARATFSGRRGDLKPGSYTLKRDMSYGSALDVLASGPPRDIVTLTIPEGRSRREVRRIVGRSLKGDYLVATRRSRLLRPRRYGATRARSLEGFLFPATYELKRGRPVRRLVEQQLQAFKRNLRGVNFRYARAKNLTPYDVLTIASMVEREARVAKERPVIASVIYNRLHRRIPLSIDATIRFATGNWAGPLTRSQLRTPSAYNTRIRAGLPPGPIGSPGLASIEAAARPARTRFLYYVVKPGTCGEHEFSRTLREHERNAARYQRARARRGGKSPTNC
jgi:UPF0755 protein